MSKLFVYSLILSQFCIFSSVYTQNLVLNPGFEETESCDDFPYVENWPASHAIDWDSPYCIGASIISPCGPFTPNQIEYYNSDSSLLFTSFAGENMAQVGLVSSQPYPENPDAGGGYLRGTLLAPLAKDSIYRVVVNLTSRANLLTNQGYSYTDQMGIHFTSKRTSYIGPECDLTAPQEDTDSLKYVNNTLKTPVGEILDQPSIWRTFCWNYQASGGEKYIMLGSFVPWVERNFVTIQPDTVIVNRAVNILIDDISVIPIPIEQADPLADTVRYICPGESIELQTRAGFGAVDWVTTGQQNQSSITVDQPGWYVVKSSILVDGQCCESCGEIVDSIRVGYAPTVGDDLLVNDSLSSCPDGFPFTVSSTVPVDWPGQLNSTTYTVTEAGTFPVSYFTACGEFIYDTLVVEMDPDLAPPSFPSSITICEEDLGTFELNAPDGYDFYSWDGIEGEQHFTVSNPGIVRFQGGDSCQLYEVEILIELVDLRYENSWPVRQTVCPEDGLVLSVPPAFSEYSWDDGFNGRQRAIDVSGTYGLTLFHACGSIRQTTEVVLLEDCSDDAKLAYIPTAFSPNLDGINDAFEVYPGPGIVAIIDIQIFDRWGGMLIDMKEPDDRYPFRIWDGNSRGQPMSNGTYMYSVTLVLFDGRTQFRRGLVTLLK